MKLVGLPIETVNAPSQKSPIVRIKPLDDGQRLLQNSEIPSILTKSAYSRYIAAVEKLMDDRHQPLFGLLEDSNGRLKVFLKLEIPVLEKLDTGLHEYARLLGFLVIRDLSSRKDVVMIDEGGETGQPDQAGRTAEKLVDLLEYVGQKEKRICEVGGPAPLSSPASVPLIDDDSVDQTGVHRRQTPQLEPLMKNVG